MAFQHRKWNRHSSLWRNGWTLTQRAAQRGRVYTVLRAGLYTRSHELETNQFASLAPLLASCCSSVSCRRALAPTPACRSDLAQRKVTGYLKLALPRTRFKEGMQAAGAATEICTSSKGMPQDIRISPDGKRFYIADMDTDGVHIVEGDALREVGFIATGLGTHGLYPSRDGKRLYVKHPVHPARGGGLLELRPMAVEAIRFSRDRHHPVVAQGHAARKTQRGQRGVAHSERAQIRGSRTKLDSGEVRGRLPALILVRDLVDFGLHQELKGYNGKAQRIGLRRPQGKPKGRGPQVGRDPRIHNVAGGIGRLRPRGACDQQGGDEKAGVLCA